MNFGRRKVNSGEPGCNIVTPLKNGVPLIENPPEPLGSPSSLFSIPRRNIEISHYRTSLILALERHISQREGLIRDAMRGFCEAYNSGFLLPEIFKKLGPISIKTLYRLKKAFERGGVDALVPQYGGIGRSKVTDHEKNFLLTLLLYQNRLKVGFAIRLLKNHFKNIGLKSPSSPDTLRRFVEDFKKKHYDLWILCREGEKALDDKVLPYIERDRGLLEVGEGLVADGHRLDFQVINPFTGKSCRPAIVMFWDWRSAYPLGWEIMLEEDVQCISSALRNSILTLGKVPKWVLIDNGKAFKAKIFTSGIDLNDTELAGMFARLGIRVHFAWPYNAKAKPIERFFGIFTEWFERMMPSYIGSSISDKPAWTRPNEKIALSLHSDWIPEISEVNQMIFRWREFYASQPAKGLGNRTPQEIFDEGKGPGVDPFDLTYQMLHREIKTVHRNGFTLFGCNWYDDALYGLKDKVIIKYSLSDLSQIFVFSKNNEFLCIAKPIPKVHPMVSESEGFRDYEDLKRRISRKRNLKRQTIKLYRLLGKNQSVLPWKEIVEEVPNVVEKIEQIEAERKETKFISPFIDEPIQDLSLKDIESEQNIIVDPRSGLTRPRNFTFSDRFEFYDWYRSVEVGNPGTLNDLDWGWIRDFEATEQWSRIYSPEDRMVRRSPTRRIERSQFRDEDENYLWLMAQDSLSQEEVNFIKRHRKMSPFYKDISYIDDEDLYRKVRSGGEDEGPICNGSQKCEEVLPDY